MKKTSSSLLSVARSPASEPHPGYAPVDLLHWAAVCFVMALIAGVSSVAAGTPVLTHAATLCCYLFALLASGLVLAGIFGARGAAHHDAGC